MRRLTRGGRSWAARRRDHGASASIVMVLLGGGVLLGATALSLDVGSLMWERRQVQNSADAAAMGLAQICAKDALACVGGSMTGLAALANVNAADNAVAFDTAVYPDGVCGRAVGGLPECAPPTGDLLDCPAIPATIAADVPFVQVYTSTRTGSGSTVLPPFVAQTFGYGGATVRACSRAAWGAPGVYSTAVPMTFSACEWRGTSGADPHADPPIERPYVAGPSGPAPGYGGAAPQPGWPLATDEVTLKLQSHTSALCPDWQGHDVAGGFGYLIESGCQAVVVTGGWVRIDTGSSAPCSLAGMRGTVVDLPIFDCTERSVAGPPTMTVQEILDAGHSCAEGTGANTWYHIDGWAKFYVSGYRISGGVGPDNAEPSYVTGTVPCLPSERCISGWFVEGILRDASSIGGSGGAGYGSMVVLPAG